MGIGVVGAADGDCGAMLGPDVGICVGEDVGDNVGVSVSLVPPPQAQHTCVASNPRETETEGKVKDRT